MRPFPGLQRKELRILKDIAGSCWYRSICQPNSLVLKGLTDALACSIERDRSKRLVESADSERIGGYSKNHWVISRHLFVEVRGAIRLHELCASKTHTCSQRFGGSNLLGPDCDQTDYMFGCIRTPWTYSDKIETVCKFQV